jgi:hypothetical protein
MKLSDKAILELREVLEAKKIFLDDLELREFGLYLLTIGVKSLKTKL